MRAATETSEVKNWLDWVVAEASGTIITEPFKPATIPGSICEEQHTVMLHAILCILKIFVFERLLPRLQSYAGVVVPPARLDGKKVYTCPIYELLLWPIWQFLKLIAIITLCGR